MTIGTRVVAIRPLDPNGADVRIGNLGTVEADAKNGFGPVVAWDKGTFCCVYDGDVEVVVSELEMWKNAYLTLQKAYAKLEDRLARVHNISGEGQ